MFRSIFALTVLFASTAYASEGPCANKAKAAAIRAYKAEVDTVQGSDGMTYSAILQNHNANIVHYVVTISENNEDGEYWEMDYSVKMKDLNGCQVLSVKKTATR